MFHLSTTLFTSPVMLGIGALLISNAILALTIHYSFRNCSDLLKLRKVFLLAAIPCGLYLILCFSNVSLGFPFPNYLTFIDSFTMPHLEYSERIVASDEAADSVPKFASIDAFQEQAMPYLFLRVFSALSGAIILLTPFFGLIIASWKIYSNGADKMKLINERAY